jgi:hypothetical protein
MDPDQNAWMRRLVWINAGRRPIMFVFVVRRLISINQNMTKYLLPVEDT